MFVLPLWEPEFKSSLDCTDWLVLLGVGLDPCSQHYLKAGKIVISLPHHMGKVFLGLYRWIPEHTDFFLGKRHMGEKVMCPENHSAGPE